MRSRGNAAWRMLFVAAAPLWLAGVGGCGDNSDSDGAGAAGKGGTTLTGSGGSGGVANTEINDTPCRSSTECAGSAMYCRPPGEPMCGPPCLSRRDCESDDECGADEVCHEIVWVPCCGWWSEPLPTRCLPQCTAGDCGDDSQCVGGRCEPILCSEGSECPPYTPCHPGDPDADANGCRRLDCETDADCEDGYCVNSSCYEALGTCTVPAT